MSKAKEQFDKAAAFQATENKQAAGTLAKPATSEDIGALEKLVGVSLPSDYKDLLHIHNGYAADSYEYDRFTIGSYWHSEWVFDSTTAVAAAWKLKNDLAKEVGNLKNDKCENGIKALKWNEKWIPVFSDTAGNSLCLDFDPGTGGKRGQLIYVEWNGWRHKVVAETFSDGLTTLVGKMTGTLTTESIGDSFKISSAPIYTKW